MQKMIGFLKERENLHYLSLGTQLHAYLTEDKIKDQMCKTKKLSKAPKFVSRCCISRRNVFRWASTSTRGAFASWKCDTETLFRDQTELRDIFRGQRDKQTPLTTPAGQRPLRRFRACIVHPLDDERVGRERTETRFSVSLSSPGNSIFHAEGARSVELATSGQVGDKVHGRRRRRRRHHRRLGCRHDAASRRQLYERT